MKTKMLVTLIAACAAICPNLMQAQISQCTGSGLTNVVVKTSNVPQTTGSTNFVLLNGATATVSIPPNSTRAIIATFSAEAQLYPNNGATPMDNWIEVRMRDNGNPIQPFDNGSPLAFAASALYEAHAVVFCKMVTNNTAAAQNHTIQAVYKVTDNDLLGNLVAWLDDWTLKVEVLK